MTPATTGEAMRLSAVQLSEIPMSHRVRLTREARYACLMTSS